MNILQRFHLVVKMGENNGISKTFSPDFPQGEKPALLGVQQSGSESPQVLGRHTSSERSSHHIVICGKLTASAHGRSIPTGDGKWLDQLVSRNVRMLADNFLES